MGRNRLCFFLCDFNGPARERTIGAESKPWQWEKKLLSLLPLFSLLARRGVTLRSPTPGDSLLEELVWKLSRGRSPSTLPLKQD